MQLQVLFYALGRRKGQVLGKKLWMSALHTSPKTVSYWLQIICLLEIYFINLAASVPAEGQIAGSIGNFWCQGYCCWGILSKHSSMFSCLLCVQLLLWYFHFLPAVSFFFVLHILLQNKFIIYTRRLIAKLYPLQHEGSEGSNLFKDKFGVCRVGVCSNI